MDKEKIQEHIKGLLEAIGENPNRDGLQRTPLRVSEAYEELFDGYTQKPEEVLNRTFEIEGKPQMIIWKDIEFDSFCEHHILPFTGFCHIGYIPIKRVVGLDKFIKLVNMYAHRLQIQERMGYQIAEAINKILKPEGVGVIIEATHNCVKMRKTKNKTCRFITSYLSGSFENDEKVRAEFLNRIK